MRVVEFEVPGVLFTIVAGLASILKLTNWKVRGVVEWATIPAPVALLETITPV